MGRASLRVMEGLPTAIYAAEALFAYVTLGQRVADELGAIRRKDRSRKRFEANSPRRGGPTHARLPLHVRKRNDRSAHATHPVRVARQKLGQAIQLCGGAHWRKRAPTDASGET